MIRMALSSLSFSSFRNSLRQVRNNVVVSVRWQWNIVSSSSSSNSIHQNCDPYVVQDVNGLHFEGRRFRRVYRKYSTDAHRTHQQAPLKGIRVLDLSRVLAGPYCTMILGDMGAEIIKIERPGTGDDTRAWGPPFIGSESCYYLCVNRNKKSITVDLKQKEGIKIIKELASVSDILVENYIPGKLSEMGLGYKDLSAEFPHLIYCSITGYGQTGKYATRAGYDVIAAGIGGLMNITGPAVS